MDVTELEVTEEIELTGSHHIIRLPAPEGGYERIELGDDDV